MYEGLQDTVGATASDALSDAGPAAPAQGPPADGATPYVELAVEVFTMLADASRVRIVLALAHRELAVSDLARAVGKSPTAASQHLAKLRLARMVAARHDGTRVYYRLADEHALRLVTEAVRQAEHAVDAHPRHHADSESTEEPA